MKPPEIIDGKRGDERSDIYSLASTVYTLAIGAPPFGRDGDQGLGRMLLRISSEAPPPLHLESAAAEFEAVLMRALSKQPGDRPQTVTEFGAQLRHSVAETTAPVPLPTESSTLTVPAPLPAPAPSPVPLVVSGAAAYVPVGADTNTPLGVAASAEIRRDANTGNGRSVKPAHLAGIVALVLAVATFGGWAIGRTVFGSDPSQEVATNDPEITTVAAIEPTAPPIPTTPAVEPTPTVPPEPTPTSAPVATPTRVPALAGGNRDATLSSSASIDGYTVVSDPSGAISVEVPSAWTSTTETSDDLADGGFELDLPYRALAVGGTFFELSGIPDLRDLSKSGIAIFATRLDVEAAPATLLLPAALVKWAQCEPGDEAEIEVDGATAAYQILACDEAATGVVVLVVVTPDDPFVAVTVDLQFAEIADLAALPTIISTIAIDPSQVPTRDP